MDCVSPCSPGETRPNETSAWLRAGKYSPRLREAGYDAQSFDPISVDLDHIAWSDFDACFIALHGGAGEDGRVQQRLERIGVPYTGSGPAAAPGHEQVGQ